MGKTKAHEGCEFQDPQVFHDVSWGIYIVLASFALQLVALSGCYMLLTVDSLNQFVKSNAVPILLIMGIITLLIVMSMATAPYGCSVFPLNVICVVIMVIAEAFLLAIVVIYFAITAVIAAIIMIILIIIFLVLLLFSLPILFVVGKAVCVYRDYEKKKKEDTCSSEEKESECDDDKPPSETCKAAKPKPKNKKA